MPRNIQVAARNQEYFILLLTYCVTHTNGLLSAFAIVTLLFAFFYRKHIPLSQPFNFDDLPPVPKKSEVIPKWECIAGICISVALTAVFLVIPQVFCMVISGTGELIPLFDPDMIRKTWWLIVLFFLCGIIRECARLQEGRYNQRVLVTTVVTNVAAAVFSICWLKGFSLTNPEFVQRIEVLWDGTDAAIGIFTHFQGFLLVCILLALALDTIEAVVKARKAG